MDNETFRLMCAVHAMQAVISSGDIVRNTEAIVARAFDVAEAMVAERNRRHAAEERRHG